MMGMDYMVICEERFKNPDMSNPNYSMLEVDVWGSGDPRCTLRKNLKTQKYELYKYYYNKKELIVVFKSENLQECLNQACLEWNNNFNLDNFKRIPDRVCFHQVGQCDLMCPNTYKRKEGD